MPHLKSLTLTPQTPRSERSPLERKRLRLIQRLETQLKAAEAALAGETYTEEVKHWVTHQETGEKTLLTQQRPVKPWWWQDDKGQWLITLRDGNRVLPISKKLRQSQSVARTNCCLCLPPSFKASQRANWMNSWNWPQETAKRHPREKAKPVQQQ